MRNTNSRGSNRPDKAPGKKREHGGGRTPRRKFDDQSPEEGRESKPFSKKGSIPGRPTKPFRKTSEDGTSEKPFRRERSERPYDSESKPKAYRKRDIDRPDEKPFRRERSERPYDPESKPKTYRKRDNDRPDEKPFRRERSERPYDPESKPKAYRKRDSDRPDEKPFRRERSERPFDSESKPKTYRKRDSEHSEEKPFRRERGEHSQKPGYYKKPFDKKENPSQPRNTRKPSAGGLTRLNKFIANAGICSRREADELIQAGVIKVNGIVITELGYKVNPGDKVQYEDQPIRSEKLVYVLLNKPKGYITTVDDPFDRKTVMALVENACKERIYPVGRLDRNTSGLLLLTNDGELAKKLTHPKHDVRKVYHVELDKPLTKADMLTIAEGVELEDGMAQVDEIAYAEGSGSKRELGVELHSGRNRIVRRIFESLGYDVVKLDRVIFAGLTKKDLPRGHWRFLTEKEVIYLRMIK